MSSAKPAKPVSRQDAREEPVNLTVDDRPKQRSYEVAADHPPPSGGDNNSP